MYHIVDRRIESEIAVREEALEAQLAYIRREGYTVLTLADVLRIVSGAVPAPERGLVFTFDDGYANNLYAAMPILREYDVEATLFVPTAYVGGHDCWNARPEDGLRYLDWHELEQWLEGGGCIGGHTHGHETANAVEFDELRTSIAVNRRLLEERLGINLTAFAYPNGVATPEARDEVARQYEVAWTVQGGTWNPQQDRFLLNRFGVARDLALLQFADELDYVFEKATGEHTRGNLFGRKASLRSALCRVTRATKGARPNGPRIALIVDAGEDNFGYPTGLRFADLLHSGCDVHLLHTGGVFDQPGIAELPEEVLLQHIHPPPLELQRLRPRFDLLGGLLRALIRRPALALGSLALQGPTGSRYLQAVLLALRPDIVHVPSVEGEEWSRLKRTLGARFVVKGAGPGSWLTADAVYVDGEHAIGDGTGDGRAAVIPRTVEPSLLEWTQPIPGSLLHVLAIGPLAWTQGYEHLLHALRLLIDRGVPCACRIVGTGEFDNALSFACHQLDLLDVVELNDPSGRREFLRHLQWADLLVNPAVVPTLPPWLLDVQAAARPLVTTPLPGGRQEPAQLVAPGDAEALADAIELVARDPRVFGRLAQEGRHRATTVAGVRTQLEAFRAFYRAAIDA